MTESIDGGKQEEFKLNEAGLAYFGGLAPVFEGVIAKYREHTPEELLEKPASAMALSRETGDDMAKLYERVRQRTVNSLFRLHKGTGEPKQVTGDPIRVLRGLNDDVFARSYPPYVQTKGSTVEGLMFNRLNRVVESVAFAGFVTLAHRASVTPNKNFQLVVERMVGADFHAAWKILQKLAAHVYGEKPLSQRDIVHTEEVEGDYVYKVEISPHAQLKSTMAAIYFHSLRDFLFQQDHGIREIAGVDDAAMKKLNDRIFGVIRDHGTYGVPFVTNPDTKGGTIENVVTCIAPLRENTYAYSNHLAQVVFFADDSKEVANDNMGRFTTLAGPTPADSANITMTTGDTCIPMSDRKNAKGKREPDMITFFIGRDNGELYFGSAEKNGLSMILGETGYETIRLGVLMELLQHMCSQEVIREHLGDLEMFKKDVPAKETGKAQKKHGRAGGKKSVLSLPRYFRRVVSNAQRDDVAVEEADEREAAGKRRSPVTHWRLLPAGWHPSQQAVTANKQAGYRVVPIPQGILDREDVKYKLPIGVHKGCAVTWLEDRKNEDPEMPGYKVEVRVDLEELRKRAVMEGKSLNQKIDELLAANKEKGAALRFYTFVQPDPEEVRMGVARTRNHASRILGKGPDQESS